MKHRWFRAKNYGWGWVPASWQGWSVIFIFVLLLPIQGAVFLGDTPSVSNKLHYVLSVLLLTALLIWVCYKTGEKPEWRWGGKTGKKK